MKKFRTTARNLAEFLGGELEGEDIEVEKPSRINHADSKSVSFLTSRRYVKDLHNVEDGGLLITSKDIVERKPENFRAVLWVSNPYLAMVKVLALWEYKMKEVDGRNLSWISSDAKIGKNTVIFPFCFVGSGVQIGENCVLFPGVFVGDFCKIGDGVVIFPNVVLYPFTEIGDNTVIHAGAVLGADGFGYITHFDEIIKVPQVGGVRIGKNVEIGANTCIDRATMNFTEVEDNVKIDNLCQIGHNSKIGRATRIAGLTGISGSVEVGMWCLLGGQVGIADHVKVGDFAILTARCGVVSDVPSGKVMMGQPALERRKFLRINAVWMNLPELLERVRKLEKKVEELSRK